jgi:protein-tyrosine phosphatase
MEPLRIIDCHNHSLPFIDDGAVDLEMALAMLTVAEQSGTTDVVLTPHHLNGAFTNFATSTIKHINSLREQAEMAGINLRLHLGSEVHLVSETAEQLIKHKALTYGGHGKAALIELPKNSIPTGVESILSELIFNGITPVIAHPERNSSLRKDVEPLKDWLAFGCKAQLTGQSCTGDFGKSLQEFSFSLISNSMAHLVASDAHRPTGRSPNLQNAAAVLTEVFGAQTCKTLLHDNPLRLIEGHDLLTLTANSGGSVSKEKTAKTSRKRQKQSLLNWLINFK